MAAPPSATHKKDLVHNLGYKPIVMAYVNFSQWGLIGWRLIPAIYWRAIGPGMYDTANIYYEHIDNNTIRFYGEEGVKIKVYLYLEPRKDAWYE